MDQVHSASFCFRFGMFEILLIDFLRAFMLEMKHPATGPRFRP